MQLAGCCYTFTCYARNIGLCPHRKNHRLGRWIVIYADIYKHNDRKEPENIITNLHISKKEEIYLTR